MKLARTGHHSGWTAFAIGHPHPEWLTDGMELELVCSEREIEEQ